MTTQLACATAALAAATAIFGQQPGIDRIRITDLQADLTFLASDALEGRRSLDRGSEVAIQFLAAEFAKAGLKPLVGDSYLQPVPLVEYRVDPNESGLTIERGSSRHVEKHGVDFFGGSPFEASAAGPVAFAGYGITAPEFGYDDYANLDARGKIVLVFEHEPQENDPNSIFNGLGNTRYANDLVKMSIAKKHGAIGILFVAEPNRKHPSGQERVARVPGSTLRARRLAPQALADHEDRLPAFSVSDAVAVELLAASGKKPGELQAAIDQTLKPVSQVLPDTRAEMRVVLSEQRRGISYNVIGMVEGSDPALRNETIVFTAHYDHDGAFDGSIRHGADDNGSGTVGVTELARAFAASPEKPKRSLLFAIFAAEERGLLGSYYYAAHPLRPLDTTRAVINFDMIGRNETPSRQTEGLIDIAPDTSNELNLIGTINSPAYRAAVEHENEYVGLKLNYKWDRDAALNIFQRSDQFPFSLHDIPAVWWFTGFHPDYHQPTDTVEKINFIKMQKILRLAYLTGWEFANASATPKFIERPMGGGAR
ncbi:MAG TPA: M28 family peptidase [Bryobacteraceae bacterium]|nr:M28 family peptidase [Bryobacteraceae bacterium]